MSAANEAPAESDVVAKLRELLKEADLDTVTTKQLRESLEKHFNAPMTGFKKAIQAEVDRFLDQKDDDEEDATVGSKRKAGAMDGALPKSSTKDGEHDFVLDYRGLCRAAVYDFKGKCLIDIRKYFEKDGVATHSKKGIALSASEWTTLCGALPQLSKALDDSDTSCCIELGNNRRASISEFGRKGVSVDVREWYDKDGEMAPGQKGCNLSDHEFASLRDNASKISAAVQQMGGGKAAAAKSGAATATSKAAASKPAAAGTKASKASQKAAGPSAAAAVAEDGTINIGGRRKVRVSEFKGRQLVDIREFYSKDGEDLPGKKGISLTTEQWRALQAAQSDVTAALKSQDMEFTRELSGKRSVAIKTFKGKVYVDIREYYQKDGEMQPGAKGITLQNDSWSALCGCMDSINQQLG